MLYLKLASVIPLLAFLHCGVNSSRILVLTIVGSHSHRATFEPLFLELANRGHQLTLLSYSFYDQKPSIKNIREINGPTTMDIFEEISEPIGDRLNGVVSEDFFELWDFQAKFCNEYFKLPEVQGVLNEKFDLVMMDICNDCALGILAHFRTPTILLSPLPNLMHMAPHFGIPTLPSSSPLMFRYLDTKMGFFQRILHTWNHVYTNLIGKERYWTAMEKYHRQQFPDSPNAHEIYENVSLILHNRHRSLDPAGVTVPGIVEIGGLHCRDPKPLPKDLQTYFDESGTSGFIYFSLGSFIQANRMPNATRDAFLNVFAKLKQRVLWKYESDMLDVKLPSNVKIIKWTPQQDVLAHPKIRLFITQGGLPSITEAVCHSVPILGIPLFYDQDGNVEKLRKAGMGLMLDIRDLNEENLLFNINRILNEPSFAQNAKMKGAEYHDNPIKPLDSAVYWTEYILKHGHNVKLFPESRRFSTLKYYSLDVLFFTLAMAIALFYTMLKIVILANRRADETSTQKIKKLK